MGEAAPHLRPPLPRRRRLSPWHGDGERGQKALGSRQRLRSAPLARSPELRPLIAPQSPSLTSPLPGSRERPVPDSPMGSSRPLLTAQPSGRAVPYVLRL